VRKTDRRTNKQTQTTLPSRLSWESVNTISSAVYVSIRCNAINSISYLVSVLEFPLPISCQLVFSISVNVNCICRVLCRSANLPVPPAIKTVVGERACDSSIYETSSVRVTPQHSHIGTNRHAHAHTMVMCSLRFDYCFNSLVESV